MRSTYDPQTMRVWVPLAKLGAVLRIVGWLRWAHLMHWTDGHRESVRYGHVSHSGGPSSPFCARAHLRDVVRQLVLVYLPARR